MDLAPFSLEMPGFCNDNNVLQRSPLFAKLAMGDSVQVDFQSKQPHIGILPCIWYLSKVGYIL
jgi:hypothetical protein